MGQGTGTGRDRKRGHGSRPRIATAFTRGSTCQACRSASGDHRQQLTSEKWARTIVVEVQQTSVAARFGSVAESRGRVESPDSSPSRCCASPSLPCSSLHLASPHLYSVMQSESHDSAVRYLFTDESLGLTLSASLHFFTPFLGPLYV